VKLSKYIFEFFHRAKWNALTFLTFVVYFASGALAADFKTIDGKEYKGATLKRVEPDGIVLVTRWGISKIYFSELPKEVQQHFDYEAVQTGASLAAEQETRSEPLLTKQAAEQQHGAEIRRIPQQTSSRSHEITTEHTYELTRDYVIGGDTGEVAMRLKRGERCRGRILADRAELDIDGTSYTVPGDILSAPKD